MFTDTPCFVVHKCACVCSVCTFHFRAFDDTPCRLATNRAQHQQHNVLFEAQYRTASFQYPDTENLIETKPVRNSLVTYKYHILKNIRYLCVGRYKHFTLVKWLAITLPAHLMSSLFFIRSNNLLVNDIKMFTFQHKQ